MKKAVKVKLELEIPFVSYNNIKLDKKAEKSIKKYIKETIKDRYVPLYVEEDEDGSFIEDTSGKIKLKEIK